MASIRSFTLDAVSDTTATVQWDLEIDVTDPQQFAYSLLIGILNGNIRKNVTAQPQDQPYVLSGLTPKTSYTVYLELLYGSTVLSEPTLFLTTTGRVTPPPPPPPPPTRHPSFKLSSFRALTAADNSVELGWGAIYDPTDGADPNYTLTVTMTNGSYRTTIPVSPNVLTVGGLSVATTYDFKIDLIFPDLPFEQSLTTQVGTTGTAPIPPIQLHDLRPLRISVVSAVIQVGSSVTNLVGCYVVDTAGHCQYLIQQIGRAWNPPLQMDGVFLSFPYGIFAEVLEQGNEFGNISAVGLGTNLAAYDVRSPASIGLGGKFFSTPLVTSWPTGRIDVFGLGTDNNLYQKTRDPDLNWSSEWHSLGSLIRFPSSAVSWGNNRIDIIGTDDQRNVKLLSWDGSHWIPSDLQFQGTGFPTICSWGPNRLDVFALGEDNALYHRAYNGNWSAWELVGGNVEGWAQPAATSWGVNRIDVVVVGTNGGLYHKWFDGQSWSPAGPANWIIVGGKTIPDISPGLASYTNTLELFVKGTDSKLYSNTYNETAWTGWVGHEIVLA